MYLGVDDIGRFFIYWDDALLVAAITYSLQEQVKNNKGEAYGIRKMGGAHFICICDFRGLWSCWGENSRGCN